VRSVQAVVAKTNQERDNKYQGYKNSRKILQMQSWLKQLLLCSVLAMLVVAVQAAQTAAAAAAAGGVAHDAGEQPTARGS
jgi:hypothetical protein